MYQKWPFVNACCVRKNYRDKCIEIYDLNPDHSYTLSGLVWLVALTKANVKLALIIAVHILLMMEMIWEVEFVTLCFDTQRLLINI